jgi:hypothetical protein
MDGKRFDKLATSLSSASSRRGVLRGVAAGGLATALAAIGISRDDAEAKHHRHKHHKRHHKKKPVQLSTNPAGAILGAVCGVTNDCGLNLVCVGNKKKKTCQGCPSACGASGKCCLVGTCALGLDICI